MSIEDCVRKLREEEKSSYSLYVYEIVDDFISFCELYDYCQDDEEPVEALEAYMFKLDYPLRFIHLLSYAFYNGSLSDNSYYRLLQLYQNRVDFIQRVNRLGGMK